MLGSSYIFRPAIYYPEYLYELLEQRPAYANISHEGMPTYDAHLEYIATRGFGTLNIWEVVFLNNRPIGVYYITHQNEIGIQIDEKYKQLGIAFEVLSRICKKYPSSRFMANIAPENKESKKLFTKLGFKCIQHTYRLD